MKKLILILMVGIVLTQTYEDVVILKNGSEIHGIIEQKPNEDIKIQSDSLNFINLYNKTIFLQTNFNGWKFYNGNGNKYSIKEYSKLIDNCDVAAFQYKNYKKNNILFWMGYLGGFAGVMSSFSHDGLNKSQYYSSLAITFASFYFSIKAYNNLFESVWEYNKCVLSK